MLGPRDDRPDGSVDPTQPSLLRGAAGQHRGVLLVHGFTGSPYELHLLADRVHAAGYGCALPRLAGHHQSLAALAATGWSDWLASAEAALHGLHAALVAQSAQPPRIAVIGLSMGGLLTLDLARRYPPMDPASPNASDPGRPQIVAISTLATPLFLHPRSERAIRRLARTPGLRALSVPKLFGADVRERGRPRPPLKPLGMPLLCLDSLLDLMARVRPQLASVRQPALLMHGLHDHTVPYACLAELARSIGTDPARLRTVSLPRSYHLLPLDVEREIVFAEVLAHLSRYL
jgi:carboxylesterase